MQTIHPAILAAATFLSTLSGGLFAIKFKDKIHSIMAFAAGVLIAVVSFDILPEIIEQLKSSDVDPVNVMIALVGGFLLFHILEKTILIHHAHEEEYAEHKHPNVGMLSALALAGHSFMDGASIGIGFQIDPRIGLLMAIAVISHDFTDGMNTVALMLANKNTVKKSLYFLVLDAAAPVLGVASTFFFRFPENFLILYLGFFAGFLLYIGASDILPEAHSKKSSLKLVGLTILGVVFIFTITRLI
jgi:ZIP family zinc transporter